jgi:hypothetical protein
VKKIAKLMLTSLLLVFLLVPVAISGATTISYEATDLTDTTPGEDLWQYSYTVDDFLFNNMNYGFTIFFDYSLYADLEDPPPYVNSDWDLLVWQPDSGIPDDGAYDAFALADGASLADPFTVSFVWLGIGAPGAQSFDVYDTAFDTVESGQTAPVPEPGTILLVGSGLLGLAGLRKKAWKGRR